MSSQNIENNRLSCESLDSLKPSRGDISCQMPTDNMWFWEGFSLAGDRDMLHILTHQVTKMSHPSVCGQSPKGRINLGARFGAFSVRYGKNWSTQS